MNYQLNQIQNVIEDISDEINIPIVALVSLNKEYNKPDVGLFTHYIPNVNYEKSIYIGDAAGRSNDWSDVDKEFAIRLGLDFQTPEEFFGGQITNDLKPKSPIRPVRLIQPDESIIQNTERSPNQPFCTFIL